MNELTNDDIWYCYCILGEISKNSESLHYQKNWMQLSPILDKFLENFVLKSLRSYQDLKIIKEIDDRGYARHDIKTAKTGGTLSWNEKNNLKISSLYLQEQFEKVVELENKGIDYWDWVRENFPDVDRYISFDGNEIYVYLDKEQNIRKPQHLPDFIFKLSDSNNPNKFEGVNTELQIAISERMVEKITLAQADSFIKTIGVIAKAVKIGRAKSVYKKSWIDEDGRSWIDFPIASNFADRDEKTFSKNDRIKDWTIIFEG